LAEAGGYVWWSGSSLLGVFDGRVGIFGCEGLEDDGFLRGFDHKEGGEDVAEGVVDLQQVSQGLVRGVDCTHGE